MLLSSLKPILNQTQFNIHFDDVSILFGMKDMKTDLTIIYIKLYIYKKRNSNHNLGKESFKAFIRYKTEVLTF